MEDYGFVRVAAAVPRVKVAHCRYNAEQALELIQKALAEHVQIVCFPELSLTGYTCGDLFHGRFLVDKAEKALQWLLDQTADLDITGIVGLPVRCGDCLFNGAAVFYKGRLLAVEGKTYLPNYNEYYERRWFSSIREAQSPRIRLCGQDVPFERNLILKAGKVAFSVELCEDLWTPIPPSSTQALAGATLVFNLSASNELLGKHAYIRQMVSQQSARCIAGYVYVSAGQGESSSDAYYDGKAMIAENGCLLAETPRFEAESKLLVSDIDVEKLLAEREKNSTFMMGVGYAGGGDFTEVEVNLPAWSAPDLRCPIDAHPFLPKTEAEAKENGREVFNIQSGALATRLRRIDCTRVVVGISGGLDSTLALLVCAHAFDALGLPRKNIIAVTMPGFGTSSRTYRNALAMMDALGTDRREISIKSACEEHFRNIGHDASLHDLTYENAQARERTQILMDVANQENAIVVGTGDLSELALGWCTYNGDQMSMYGVNAGVPKTLVAALVKYAADYEMGEAVKPYLYDVMDTPISPELLPASNDTIAQKSEDLVGPYELHDFILYHFLKNGFRPSKIHRLACLAFEGIYTSEVVAKWVKVFFRRFFAQQFKRQPMPDGPKAVAVGLSPRGDWRMPSDAYADEWLADCPDC